MNFYQITFFFLLYVLFESVSRPSSAPNFQLFSVSCARPFVFVYELMLFRLGNTIHIFDFNLKKTIFVEHQALCTEHKEFSGFFVLCACNVFVCLKSQNSYLFMRHSHHSQCAFLILQSLVAVGFYLLTITQQNTYVYDDAREMWKHSHDLWQFFVVHILKWFVSMYDRPQTTITSMFNVFMTIHFPIDWFMIYSITFKRK